jgi:ATP adenylyltransferase
MAVINRHLGTLPEAATEEMTGAMELVSLAISILSAEYRPEGFNVGLNQGRVAGAGIVDHLHLHVVPRWNRDNSFIAVVGETRVLPETLETTYDRLKGRLGG